MRFNCGFGLTLALALTLAGRALPQDAKKSDPALEAARKAYEQDLRKLDEAFQTAKKKRDEDAAKAREKLIKVYDEAIKRTTQKGDLEGANKLLAEKKTLEAGVDLSPAGGEATSGETFDPTCPGLVGIVESKSGDTHLLMQFNSKVDRAFWRTKVIPKLNGLYSGEPTLKVAGFIVCRRDLTLTLDKPEPNEVTPIKVLLDDKAITMGSIPLTKGIHRLFIDFGRHNADGEPGTLLMSSKDGPREFGCFHNKALFAEAAARVPKPEAKKPATEVIATP